MSRLLRHIYTKFHNPQKYHEIEEVTKKRARKVGSSFILKCPYGCGQNIIENKKSRLANCLMTHRFTLKKHNPDEFKNIAQYVDSHLKKVTN